jgi:hypothetical protein
MVAGILLGGRELPGLVIPHVTPGEAIADHLQVDEAFAKVDASDLALVAVDVDHVDADDLAEHLLAQRLPGPIAERLAFLGRVVVPDSNPIIQRRRPVNDPAVENSAEIPTMGDGFVDGGEAQ